MARRDWSEQEVRATIASYLRMLEMAHRGERFVKAQEIRNVQRRLAERTNNAVEKKYQNISAVMVELGLDYLDGYVPLFNYQRRLLPDLVRAELEARPTLVERLGEEAEAAPALPPDRVASQMEIVEAPKLEHSASERSNREPVASLLAATTLAERQDRNAALGRAGEETVVEFERRRLHDAGRRELSKRVEHVAVTQGDGLGYDVASYEPMGTPILIEVKTTRWGAMTRFFVTRNELQVSRVRSEAYRLYRLFRFESTPRVFVLPGALDRSCRLEPTAYQARIA